MQVIHEHFHYKNIVLVFSHFLIVYVNTLRENLDLGWGTAMLTVSLLLSMVKLGEKTFNRKQLNI